MSHSIENDATHPVNSSRKIAYLGPQGTFTYQAAVQEFESNVAYVPVTNLCDIVGAVESGETELGVLPFENSSNGHVVASLDLLRAVVPGSIEIVGEIYLDVHQCLLSSTGLQQIKRIYSHPQAFGQCETFLSLHLPGIERINVSSTGKAAQLASKDPEAAAIGSSSSAQAVGIQILHADIEDNKNNTTRFFVLSKSRRTFDLANRYKSLIRFTVPHTKPGSLATTLQGFAQSSINLTSISSRPNVSAKALGSGQKWVYVFFIEFEGHGEDDTVRKVLETISSNGTADELTVLGSFIDVRADGKNLARLRGGAPSPGDQSEDESEEEKSGSATLERQQGDGQQSLAAEDDIVDRPTRIIEGEQISADEDLLDDYPLDTEDISCLHSRIRSIPSLHLERFQRLKTICLRQNEITKIQDMPRELEELDLYDNLIGHMDGLENLDNLTSLDLSFNKIKHIKNINHLKKLQTLYLVQNKISRIEGLEGLIELTMLELGANRIREIENLETLKSLQELWLGKNKITEIKNLESLPGLRLLSIQSNRLLQITGLESLAETLEELYISHNGLTSLEGLAPLRALKVLDISNNSIAHLTHISHLSQLTELWASNNQLESFDEIERECRGLQQLDTVYFEGNPLQRKNPTTYRNKVKLSVNPSIKQIDANILRI